MKALLIVFTLCGSPHYLIMQDGLGYASGSPSQAPQEAVERMRAIVNSKDSIISKIPVEDLSGLLCV